MSKHFNATTLLNSSLMTAGKRSLLLTGILTITTLSDRRNEQSEFMVRLLVALATAVIVVSIVLRMHSYSIAKVALEDPFRSRTKICDALGCAVPNDVVLVCCS